MRREVIKHSAAIQISNKLTLLQRRLYNVLLGNAYNELPYADTHHVDVEDICETLKYESKNIQHLKTSFKGLMTTVVEWNILGKSAEDDWQASTLLADAGLTNGVFTYSYSPYLRKKLYNPEIYARISLSLQNDFKSTHSLAVYELLLDYYDHRKSVSRTPYITVEEFRSLLGITPGAYQEFKILKRDIISKALDEINDISDIEADVTFKRVGRSIGKMQFTIKRNQKNAVPDKILAIPKQPPLPESGLEIKNQNLLKRLVEDYGVELKCAINLLETYDEFQVKKNLLVVEEAAKTRKISQNIAGFVVKAIKGNWTPTTTKKLEVLQEKKKIAQDLQKKEEKRAQEKNQRELKKLLESFEKIPTSEQDSLLNQFSNTLEPVVKNSFINSGRDVSSPIYSLGFLYFIRASNIDLGV